MLRHNTNLGVSALMIVLLIIVVSVGCTVQKDNFDVIGISKDENQSVFAINTVEEIMNVVTDDDKLVINYYDAYTWVVLFDEDNRTTMMLYIYKFDTAEIASDMLKIRKEELEKNRTMTIESCRQIEEYIVVELTDSSFDNVSREMLENNFSGLIVY